MIQNPSNDAAHSPYDSKMNADRPSGPCDR